MFILAGKAFWTAFIKRESQVSKLGERVVREWECTGVQTDHIHSLYKRKVTVSKRKPPTSD